MHWKHISSAISQVCIQAENHTKMAQLAAAQARKWEVACPELILLTSVK